MSEAQRPNSSTQFQGRDRDISPEPRASVLGGTRAARSPEDTVRLLTLSEAEEIFKVDYKTIYRLAELGHIEALQRDGKGRKYYSERQIARALNFKYLLVAA